MTNDTPGRQTHRAPPRWGLDLRDERGSLPMLMMVILVGVVLSTFMVSVVVSQTTSTRFATSREQALNAAQAGIDVALARIRASTTAGANTPGILTGLPCWSQSAAAAYSGAVVSDPFGTTVGSGSYSVFVDYYMKDPVLTGLDPATNPPMVCSPGYGTYDPKSGQSTPLFALITSTGTVAGGGTNGTTSGRTLASTYVFRIDNRNIPGGQIKLYPAAGKVPPGVCLDAGTSTPNPDTPTPVTMQPCSQAKPPLLQQVFAYRTDLTIQLVSSVNAATGNPDGVCLDAGDKSKDGDSVFLMRCAPLPDADPFSSANWWQQWSFNDNGHLEGAKANTGNDSKLSGSCITATTQTAGQKVTVDKCNGTIDDPKQAWIPFPDVGAGAATSPRPPDGRQYVNFGEFGRCMDVTDQNPDSDHFILYPCKQNPSRKTGTVAWNQLFNYEKPVAPATSGRLITNTKGKDYCVTAPVVLGDHVNLLPCATAGVVALRQRWVDTGDSTTLSYTARNTVVDYQGRCLSLTDPIDPKPWRTLDVEACIGSGEQKWNAAANLTEANPQNTVEK